MRAHVWVHMHTGQKYDIPTVLLISLPLASQVKNTCVALCCTWISMQGLFRPGRRVGAACTWWQHCPTPKRAAAAPVEAMQCRRCGQPCSCVCGSMSAELSCCTTRQLCGTQHTHKCNGHCLVLSSTCRRSGVILILDTASRTVIVLACAAFV
jgi:hypothetical protein